MKVEVNTRKKITVCIFVIIISFFVIGAGRVTKELNSRKINREAEHQQWLSMVSSMSEEIPVEYKQEWLDKIAENPRFFLKICTVNFRAVEKGELKN